MSVQDAWPLLSGWAQMELAAMWALAMVALSGIAFCLGLALSRDV